MKIRKNHNYNLLRVEAKAKIDTLAEKARSAFMTNILGQDYIYQAKANEAILFNSQETPNGDQFPFLLMEAQASGKSLKDVAAQIIESKFNTDTQLAKIEYIRRTAKLKIDQCEDKISVIDDIVNNTLFD